MTLTEIKAAVDAGKPVHWCNTGYSVIKDSLGQYLVVFRSNAYCFGLTHQDGVTLNGKEHEFFVAGEVNEYQVSTAFKLLQALEQAQTCGLISEAAARLAPIEQSISGLRAALHQVISEGSSRRQEDTPCQP